MFWEFFLTFLTFLQSPSEDPLPNTAQFNPIQEQVHSLSSSDDGIMLYNPESPGPKSPQERELARRALHGGYKGRGDMVFSHEELEGKPVDNLFAIKSWRPHSRRWPGYPGRGRIPYVIDISIDDEDHNTIRTAINQFNRLTCVQFSRRQAEQDYVTIYKGEGCWSQVGKLGGQQYISLGEGCMFVGTIVHELGHTIGFLHEHQRHDRDDYITYYEGNVTEGLQNQFHKMARGDEITYNAFDYNSIMIYGNYAFSIHPGRLMTIEALNGVPITNPFEKRGLDNSDVERVNAMYECR